jgi:putative membrane protein
MLPIFRRLAIVSSLCMGAALTVAGAAESSVDAVFVGSVSQGGRYEVEASTLALRRATAADVKDLANSEVHDHELVNAKLKRLAETAGIPIEPQLNAMFQQRLATLRASSPADFDKAYIADMKEIHDKDEKLFATEAEEGGAAFKPFAHQTDLIVKRHIGALKAND